jgi:signal peptidase II
VRQEIKNKIREKRRFFIGLAVAVAAIIADRITKNAILGLGKIFSENGQIVVCPGLNGVLEVNRGIAFGVFNGGYFENFMPIFFLIFSTAIVLYILCLFWNDPNNCAAEYSLFIGGGIGNIIDRITIGAVTDFLDFYIGKYHWPAFNLADSFICIGVFLFLLKEIIKKKK